jgi:hypothetical protein
VSRDAAARIVMADPPLVDERLGFGDGDDQGGARHAPQATLTP